MEATKTNKESPVATQPLVRNVPKHFVKRLEDLALKLLAERFAGEWNGCVRVKGSDGERWGGEECPVLDSIPEDCVDEVVKNIDVSKLKFALMCRTVEREQLWEKMCQERWKVCKPQQHGMSWKRQYSERYIQELLENYHPSNDNVNASNLKEETFSARSHVHALEIRQFLSHEDIGTFLLDFPNLHTLSITYGSIQLGMGFDRHLIGMKKKDADFLAHFISRSKSLTSLRYIPRDHASEISTHTHILCSLINNEINDSVLDALLAGITRSSTLVSLSKMLMGLWFCSQVVC